MQMIRCINCMELLGQGVRVCPYCGYDQMGDVQPANALRRNTILHGRYLIGKVIGQGGFGITYVGYDLTLEMKVAVKEYFPSGAAVRTGEVSSRIQWDFACTEEAQWSEGIERFLREAKRMAKLDSVPSIVRVRDAFRENQTAYIVMDFVEGETLKEHLINHGVLCFEACMQLFLPVLDSLAVIHDNGFIHRDISPDNIMIQSDGSVRLLDMGAAVDVKATGGRASMMVIKKNFSAPEQYMESGVLGSWTDVYSMAATIYYCLTGRLVPEAMEREFKNLPIRFEPGVGIPQYAEDAIAAALELDPEKRIRNMREFKKQLTTLATAENEKVTVPHTESIFKKKNVQDENQTAGTVAKEPFNRFTFVGIMALEIIIGSLITIGLLKTPSEGIISMCIVGAAEGAFFLSRSKKIANQRRGQIYFIICLAACLLMGWLLSVPVFILLLLYLRKEEIEFVGKNVSSALKAGMVVTALVSAAMVGLTLIGAASLLEESSSISLISEIETTASENVSQTAESTKRVHETDAVEEYEIETDEFGAYVRKDDNTYALVECFSQEPLIWIPAEFNGLQVQSVLQDAFLGNTEVQQVRFSQGIQYLDEGIFNQCENLRAIFIPDSVEQIAGSLISEESEMNYRVLYFTEYSADAMNEMADVSVNWKGEDDCSWNWTWYAGMTSLEGGRYRGWIMNADDRWMFYEDGFTKFGWQTINGMQYYFEDKATAATGWRDSTNYTYYFDEENCNLVTGWKEIEGLWYYFDLADGHLLRDTYTPDGYYIDESGVYTG